MCYETTARPPLPPVGGGAASTGNRLTLHSADETEFLAFEARAVGQLGNTQPGIVILPDVRGLHPFYRDLALRFADIGVHAVAIDYFGRTAGLADRSEDFDFTAHVQQLSAAQVAKDVSAGIGRIREMGAEKAFTVGFCMGGRASFNQSRIQKGLSGVIGFYGRVAARDESDDDAPIDHASDFKAPVLGLFGGADEMILPETIESFRDALSSRGVSVETVIYPGAPHSFFDRRFDQFKHECNDAWRRILGFIKTNAAA